MTLAGAVLLIQIVAAVPPSELAPNAGSGLEPLAAPAPAVAGPAAELAAPLSGLAALAVSRPLTPPLVAAPAPSPLVRLPEVRPISRNERIAWTALTFSAHAAAAFDARTTRLLLHRYDGRELNPFLRPFASSDGGLFAATQLSAGGANYLGRRMLRSQNRVLRRLWWVPQTVSLAGSLFGGFQNLNQIHKLHRNSVP